MVRVFHLSVPPLEGFVMNRVLGDYFETLLYKIFVSIDEHTTVAEVGSLSLQLLSRKTCIIMAKKKESSKKALNLLPHLNV